MIYGCSLEDSLGMSVLPRLNPGHRTAVEAELLCFSHSHWLQPKQWSFHEALSDSFLVESEMGHIESVFSMSPFSGWIDNKPTLQT